MDEVFGDENFVSLIPLRFNGKGSQKSSLMDSINDSSSVVYKNG